MKAPLEWLLSYTDVKINGREEIHAFAGEMTLSGTKVESVESTGQQITDVVVAKCISVRKHENSDHLMICQMDVGGPEPLQIVTGAPNVREGAYIPAALDGAVIAEGKVIKNGKLRGADSFGMMCSFEELGLDDKDYPGGIRDGLIILQDLADFKELTEQELNGLIGKNIMEVLGANETVIDFEVTSNRPDCFSMIGLGREAAITMKGHFQKPAVSVKEESPIRTADVLSVKIAAPELCPLYAARVVTDVKIAPSPKWLRNRLRAAGVRSINNIVDITNYVMLEYGQPMHAFDKRTIHENEIIVRRAEDGETIRTLDGQDRTLDKDMLVISDCAGAVAVAGVMGGENSEITADTSEIIFEAAVFDGVTVRRGAKKIGLRTESSSRFEKGLDPITCYEALERAAQLVELLGAGKVCKGIVDCMPAPKAERRIPFSPEKINAFLGIHASAEEMTHILTRLECRTDLNAGVVIPPSFRDDLICSADIAEEIARFYGYNKIESRLLTGCETTLGQRNRKQKLSDQIRAGLSAMGYHEMLTFSFISPNVFDRLRLPAESPLRDAVVIRNPLGEDYSIMRTTMLPSILESLGTNHAHRVAEARLFELSYVYIKQSADPEVLPAHRQLVTFGGYAFSDFFAFKGHVEGLLQKLKIKNYEFEPERENPSMHPGRTARLYIGGEEAGFFGQIHPQTAENWECPEQTYVACLLFDVLLKYAVDIPKNQELPKFPAVTRDLAVVLDRETPAGHAERIIRERGGKLLESCTLFDCYEGAQVPEGKKSLAYSLSFRDASKTLTDEDVNKTMKKILNGLETKLQAVLRS